MRRSLTMAVGTTVVLALAGCQDGSSLTGRSSSPPQPPPTSAASGQRPSASAHPPAPDLDGLSGTPASYRRARSHPVRDSYYPQHGVPYLDTLHYLLDLDWRPTKRILSGTATIDFRVTTKRDTVRFELGAPMRVGKVVLDGRSVRSSRSGNNLLIKTGALKANSRHHVAITYAGRPALIKEPAKRSDGLRDGFHSDAQGRAWTFQEPFGALTWYPTNDQPADKAYYDAKLTAHDGQKGVFNGQVTSTIAQGDTTTTSFHLDEPASSYLTTVAFGKYQHQTVAGPHGLPINYWYTASDGAAMKMVRKTPAMLRWAEKYLGPYPFASAGYVLVPGNSGMETQTLVTFSSSPEGTLDPVTFQGDVAHELIHQWFGDEITPAHWKDLWLNEGLTMYYQYRYLDQAGLASQRTKYAQLQNGMDQVWRDRGGPPGAFHKGDFADINVYDCVALMLYNLEKAYGRTKLDTALRGWPATAKYGNSDRRAFIDYLSKKLGPAAGPYVSNWLTATKTPKPLAKQPG